MGVAQSQTDVTQPVLLEGVSDLATVQIKMHWPVGTERKRKKGNDL